jgi:hypothetical protein
MTRQPIPLNSSPIRQAGRNTGRYMEFMEGRALGKEKVKQNAKNKKEPEATGNGV